MISLERVTKIYEQNKQTTITAVDDVSLQVERGEFLVVTGRSGSGKTTLINLVAGLTRPTSGKVLLEGVEVWRLPDPQQAALRNRKIGFVFQFPSLMPSLSVLENVVLPTIFAGRGPAGEEEYQQAEALLAEVGLTDKLDAYPRQLSAGQQQRVVIARSLINRPELILADEPTSNLDEQTEHEIMALFQAIHIQRGVTLMLVTHSGELVSYGTHGLHMSDGKVVQETAPDSVLFSS